MTTRAALRAALRRRLEDTAPAPLWDDPTLNDALAAAVRGYGARVPAEAVLAVAVPAGATRVPVAEPIDPDRIVRVLDGAGAVVPRHEPMAAAGVGAPGGQGWRWWGEALLLSRLAAAGPAAWRIEHLAPRDPPSDDAEPVAVPPADEEIVLALAAATALRRRAVEDAKRGDRALPTAALAAVADAEATRLFGARRRRARGGRLDLG